MRNFKKRSLKYEDFKSAVFWLVLVGMVITTLRLLVPDTAAAQTYTPTAPDAILGQYRAFRATWITNIWTYANRLFSFLAIIEFAWSAIALALDKTDLQSWTSGLIRRVMWLGAFYALLVNGPTWIPAIITSFEEIGFSSAGLGAPLHPSSVLAQGLGIAGALMRAASLSGFFTNFGTSLALVFAAVIIVISFALITINFIVTLVESYVVVSAGFLFLGFGGSRWTAPYAERYIGLAVSTGVKLLLLYCLIAAGSSLATGWEAQASAVGTSPEPALSAFEIMGAALIYMMICWQSPKLFGAVLGGSPALTGGDLMGAGMTVVGAGMAAASLATGAGAAVAGKLGGGAAATTAAGASAGSGGGANSVAAMVNAVSAANTNVDPPTTPVGKGKGGGGGGGANGSGNGGTRGTKTGAASDVANVSANGSGGSVKAAGKAHGDGPKDLAAVGGEALAGSGFEAEKPAKGFSSAASDVASVSSPKGGPRGESKALAGMGGEPLAGSGFEGEKPPQGFAAPETGSASGEASATANASSPAGSGSTGAAADVQNVSSPSQKSPQRTWRQRIASTAKKTDQGLRSTQDRFQEARRRIGPLSDAASPPQPPRMPIDSND